MSPSMKTMTILLADDDPEEATLIRAALEEAGLSNDLRVVGDGEELLDYLYRRDRYADPQSSPRPGLILLDLNMPRMTGHEALQEIKSDPALRRIPVVVLTISKEDDDLACSFLSGASAHMTKPMTGDKLAKIMAALERRRAQASDTP